MTLAIIEALLIFVGLLFTISMKAEWPGLIVLGAILMAFAGSQRFEQRFR